MKQSIKKFLKPRNMLMVIFLISAVWVFKLSFIEYPYYFTDLCRQDHEVKTPENKIIFRLSDENNKPLGCRKIRIEEESACAESPCPDFSVIRRTASSENGTIAIPERMLNDILKTNLLPSGQYSNQKKEFLFHAEGNYNIRITYEALMAHASEWGAVDLKLIKSPMEQCRHPRRSFRSNYCDGY